MPIVKQKLKEKLVLDEIAKRTTVYVTCEMKPEHILRTLWWTFLLARGVAGEYEEKKQCDSASFFLKSKEEIR